MPAQPAEQQHPQHTPFHDPAPPGSDARAHLERDVAQGWQRTRERGYAAHVPEGEGQLLSPTWSRQPYRGDRAGVGGVEGGVGIANVEGGGGNGGKQVALNETGEEVWLYFC